MEGEDRTFRVNFSTEGVSALRDVVRVKLKEFMGDYTDDTLVDYVIVLLKNGRRKDEAKNELDVFLGDDSDPFISWLWDHLGSNLSLYVKTEDINTGTEANREPVAQEQVNRSGSDAKKRKSDRLHAQEIEIPEKKGNEINVPHSHGNTVNDKKRSHTEIHQEAARTKESPSPRPTHDKERRQTEEKKRRKRDVRPTPVSAPTRLLQFAVREAVATSTRPSLKRLRSVVTKTTEDTTADEHSKRSRHISMSAAIKAVAEAANDVRKAQQSRNVFDRIGHGDGFPYAPSSQDFEFATKGVVGEDLRTEMAGLQSGYHVQNDSSRLHFPVHDQLKNDREDFVFDMRQRETTGFSQSGSLGGNWVENSQTFLSSGTSTDALHGPHKGSIQSGALANDYHRKPSSLSTNTKKLHNRQVRDASEMENRKHVGDIRSFEPEVMSKNVVDFNGNVKPDTSLQKSQKAQSQIGLQHTVIPTEDADSRTIFVNNVHFAASKDSLSRHFNKFGEVLKVIILTDPSTGQPKGSAYIEFMRKDAAELALSLNGTSFMSRILKIVKKSSAQPEATSVLARPPARAAPFPSQPFIRAPVPRGIPNLYRARLPVKPGSRSFQWKRESASNVTENAAQASSSKLPPTRSFTYVRLEQKADANSGNT